MNPREQNDPVLKSDRPNRFWGSNSYAGKDVFPRRHFSLLTATQILKAGGCFPSAFCICILTDKLEFVYFLMIVFHHFIIELIDSASPTQHHTEHCAYSCLQDLIRHFEDCVFGCTVNKSSAE